MSMHIVDDEQRSDRRVTPMRPSGSGLAGTSASWTLLDDVHRHRLRRAASHLPLPGQERGPSYYSDRLLVDCRYCGAGPCLAGALYQVIDLAKQKLKSRQLGKILDQPQPRISELLNGKISKMSAEKLAGDLSR